MAEHLGDSSVGHESEPRKRQDSDECGQHPGPAGEEVASGITPSSACLLAACKLITTPLWLQGMMSFPVSLQEVYVTGGWPGELGDGC